MASLGPPLGRCHRSREHPPCRASRRTGANVDRRELASVRRGAEAPVAEAVQGTFLNARASVMPRQTPTFSIRGKGT